MPGATQHVLKGVNAAYGQNVATFEYLMVADIGGLEHGLPRLPFEPASLHLTGPPVISGQACEPAHVGQGSRSIDGTIDLHPL